MKRSLSWMRMLATKAGSLVSSVARRARASVHGVRIRRNSVDPSRLVVEPRAPTDPEFEQALLDMTEVLEIESLLSDLATEESPFTVREPFPETDRFEREFRPSASRDFLQDYLEALAPSGDATSAFARTR